MERSRSPSFSFSALISMIQNRKRLKIHNQWKNKFWNKLRAIMLPCFSRVTLNRETKKLLVWLKPTQTHDFDYYSVISIIPCWCSLHVLCLGVSTFNFSLPFPHLWQRNTSKLALNETSCPSLIGHFCYK